MLGRDTVRQGFAFWPRQRSPRIMTSRERLECRHSAAERSFLVVQRSSSCRRFSAFCRWRREHDRRGLPSPVLEVDRRRRQSRAKLLDGFLSLGRGADLARLAADPGATRVRSSPTTSSPPGIRAPTTRDGPASFGFTARAAVERARFHQTAGLLRRRDRLLGRSARALRVASDGRYRCGRDHRRLGHLRRAARGEARRRRREGRDPGGRARGSTAATATQRFWNAADQGARVPLSADARRPSIRSATISTTGTGRPGRTNSRAPISRWSAARPGTGSARACASCPTTSA